MKILSLILTFILIDMHSHAYACSPLPNFLPPKLQENYQKSQIVAFGIVERRDILKDGSYKLRVRVEKVWKGNPAVALNAFARPGSTCDGFGTAAVEASGCLLFLNDGLNILSGINAGESSFCIPAGSPRLKTLVAEYDARFKASDDKTDCNARGGRWEGVESGRGRLTGCNLPTSDAGKKCSRAEDCQSVCLKDGTCHGWSLFKGCARFHGREGIQCIE